MSIKATYIRSDSYVKICDSHPRVSGRATLVDALVHSYGLLYHTHVVEPDVATELDLRAFHSREYVDALRELSNRTVKSGTVSNDSEVEESLTESDDDIAELKEEFGFLDDAYVFKGMWQYACAIGGASLTAARALTNRTSRYAINWGGGWHHAHREQANGFCYINDIVLAILELKTVFDFVMYIDLDLHHGDGVQEAFKTSPTVLTISLHKYAPGFYPGTGDIDDIGINSGKYYSVNIPLLDGCNDAIFVKLFIEVFEAAIASFQPTALVVQCGADGLLGDPNSCFNLTTKGYGACVSNILSHRLPTMFVGGGGYSMVDTARVWAYLTSLIVNFDQPECSTVRIDERRIPPHGHFTKYGPHFGLHTFEGNQANENTTKDIDKLIAIATKRLQNIIIADDSE
eukprot:CFRG6284T1